jgi:hypothetical protein
MQLQQRSGNDSADARRRCLLGTAPISEAANDVVRMGGVVPVGVPDREYGHRHDRRHERDQCRQRYRRDDDDHDEDRERRDEQQGGDGDRGELGHAECSDSSDSDPREGLFWLLAEPPSS